MKKAKIFLDLIAVLSFISFGSFFCAEDDSTVAGNYTSDGSSGLRANILVPPALAAENVKVKITVNYDFPNSDGRDKTVYECKDANSTSQFIETIVPQLEPGIIRLECSIFLYEGEGSPGCDDDMSDWTLYCSAFKPDVEVLINQLVRVPMNFVCSDNAEDFGDIEIQVEGVYMVKKVVGSTYRLPIEVTKITSGDILANVELQLFDGSSVASNQIIINDLSGSDVQYNSLDGTTVNSDADGIFIFNAYIPQSIFVGTSTPTLWVLANFQGATEWYPVEIYQLRNECTVMMDIIMEEEFQVNTYTVSYQYYSSIAIDGSSNFVIAWESNEQDGDEGGIFAQRYDVSGDPQGSEFQVNTYTEKEQYNPVVAMNAAGSFVIVWNSEEQDGDERGVFAQRYDAGGNTQGSEFQINTYTNSYQYSPSVGIDINGNFVIVWESYNQDGSGYGVFAQRYDAGGNAQGSEFQVNTYTVSNQYYSAVSMNSVGNFVITWESYSQDGSGYGIFAQRYDAGGNPQGSEFQVNTYTTLGQYYPAIDMDNNGNFVIVWESYAQDGDSRGIFAQRYDATGNLQGSEFQVNTHTASIQYANSVAMNPVDGNFIITWVSYLYSNNMFYGAYTIFAQRYDASGTAQGSEFQVNTYRNFYSFDPSVGMNSNGRFVISWDAYGQDDSASGVYARMSQLALN